MGLNLFSSSCSVGTCTPATPRQVPGNPDPRRYRVVRRAECRGWVVVEVVYPDARNYEGRKILVYACTDRELRRRAEAEGALDPHFCDDGAHLSPFARFEPTERGWAAAIRCAAETAPEPDLLQPDERALVEGLERERIGLATGGERGLLAIVRRLARRRSK